MQTQIRVLLIMVIRLVHDEASATAAETRKSAAGETGVERAGRARGRRSCMGAAEATSVHAESSLV
jgi:hypothetical protein